MLFVNLSHAGILVFKSLPLHFFILYQDTSSIIIEEIFPILNSMSLDKDIEKLANDKIDDVVNDINIFNKKGKDIAYFSAIFPWVLLFIWRLLWYANILPGIQSDISGLAVIGFIIGFIIIWGIIFSFPIYLTGLYIIWKPVRKLLPSLPFYGCFTQKGCEQLKKKLNDAKFEKQSKTPITKDN